MEHNEHYELVNTAPVLKLRSEINIVANLQKWFDKKYQMVTGEKNNNLFKLASAFNDFGLAKHVCENYLIQQYGSKKTEKEIRNAAFCSKPNINFLVEKRNVALNPKSSMLSSAYSAPAEF